LIGLSHRALHSGTPAFGTRALLKAAREVDFFCGSYLLLGIYAVLGLAQSPKRTSRVAITVLDNLISERSLQLGLRRLTGYADKADLEHKCMDY
jgi:hypothetical protein